MPHPSLKRRLSGAFFINWEIKLSPHGAAPQITFLMTTMMMESDHLVWWVMGVKGSWWGFLVEEDEEIGNWPNAKFSRNSLSSEHQR